MDKLTRYGELIQDILREYASYKPSTARLRSR